MSESVEKGPNRIIHRRMMALGWIRKRHIEVRFNVPGIDSVN